MVELCLKERLMIVNPLQNCIRSYDILHFFWTHRGVNTERKSRH